MHSHESQVPQLSGAARQPGEHVPEEERAQASRQKAEAAAFATMQCILGGRGNGKGDEGGDVKLSIGCIQ